MEHEDGFRSRVLRLELSSLKIYTHVTLSAPFGLVRGAAPAALRQRFGLRKSYSGHVCSQQGGCKTTPPVVYRYIINYIINYLMN